MSKVVSVSDDAGSTWYDIPGPSASFTRDGQTVNDAILGQTYDSMRAGLITWSIGANGYYKGVSGYVADLKKDGTPTATTGEAMSLVTGKTYRIDDAAKEVWNPDATITVYDNAVDQTANVESYDYLFGKVTFLSAYTVTGPITIDVTYYPLATFGKAREFSLTQSANARDTSDYQTVQGNNGYRTHASGLRNITLELSGIFNASDDWAGELQSRSRILIEIDPAGDTYSKCRGWYNITTANQEGDVGDNETETVNFVINVDASDRDPFSWDHNGSSTLSTAIQKTLTAFESQIDIDVRYLYDGTNGWSGTSVVSEASLSGSIDGMNEFSFTFTGDGGITAVP